MDWSNGWFPGRLVELDAGECWELMETQPVGRIAYGDQDGPVVLPVSYVVHDGGVVFATSPHSVLARHFREGPAAFEVDQVEPFHQTGWSVLLRGTARVLDHDELPARDDRPVPWAEGPRTLLVRVEPRSVTGRRLLPA